jgi:hypothetical protein
MHLWVIYGAFMVDLSNMCHSLLWQASLSVRVRGLVRLRLGLGLGLVL